jgi:hypothetical protein
MTLDDAQLSKLNVVGSSPISRSIQSCESGRVSAPAPHREKAERLPVCQFAARYSLPASTVGNCIACDLLATCIRGLGLETRTALR